MTGDVLSPRYSTEDTDEQPAIQVSGNETYILPPGGEPLMVSGEGVHDVLDAGVASQDVLGASGSPQDVLGPPSGPHDVLVTVGGLGALSGPHDTLSGEPYDGSAEPGVDEESPYLPLDRGYEEPEPPRRGFLGSGWTDDAHDDGRPGGEREVRRRTRVLVLAAAGVVLVGVGAGWMLTGASSDDPCAAGRCASASEVSAPAGTASPEGTDGFSPEPTYSDTAEPTVSESVSPTPTVRRAQPTREPSVRPTPTTRSARPTRDPGTTHAPRGEMNDTSGDTQDDGGARPTTSKQAEAKQPTTAATTQAPEANQPAPTPTESKKGLFDILFPWA